MNYRLACFFVLFFGLSTARLLVPAIYHGVYRNVTAIDPAESGGSTPGKNLQLRQLIECEGDGHLCYRKNNPWILNFSNQQTKALHVPDLEFCCYPGDYCCPNARSCCQRGWNCCDNGKCCPPGSLCTNDGKCLIIDPDADSGSGLDSGSDLDSDSDLDLDSGSDSGLNCPAVTTYTKTATRTWTETWTESVTTTIAPDEEDFLEFSCPTVTVTSTHGNCALRRRSLESPTTSPDAQLNVRKNCPPTRTTTTVVKYRTVTETTSVTRTVELKTPSPTSSCSTKIVTVSVEDEGCDSSSESDFDQFDSGSDFESKTESSVVTLANSIKLCEVALGSMFTVVLLW